MTKIFILSVFCICALFISCKRTPADEFKAYTISLTYANGNICKEDSMEMTSAVCLSLIHFDNSGNCYAYDRMDSCRSSFYKGVIPDSVREHLKNTIIELHNKFPKEYIEDATGSCAPDISIVLESDTATKFHFIQISPKLLDKEINHFISLLNPIEKNETVLKYKYYITTKVAYLYELRYGFAPINGRYLPHVEFKKPTIIDEPIE